MSDAKIIELNDDNTCKLCENALGKYTCPRCNVLYCSLTCYQTEKHVQCSENFYRECVMKDLSLKNDTDDSKAAMMEILQRMHESNESPPDNDEPVDSDDDEACADIAERLAGIDLDKADKVWEKLTDDERQEFVAFLKSEDVSKLIPKWEPWWLHVCSKKVQEVEESELYKLKCPEIKELIKDFSNISSKEPADCVQYNLINILAAYAFTARYFNGDYYDFAAEAVSCITSLSLCLKSNENFPDFETAVKSIEQQCINSDWIVTDQENINTMKEDLDRILQGPEKNNRKYYILCALSDLHNLLRTVLKGDDSRQESNFSKHFPDPHFPSVALESKAKIKCYMKKLEYFLSYTKYRLEF